MVVTQGFTGVTGWIAASVSGVGDEGLRMLVHFAPRDLFGGDVGRQAEWDVYHIVVWQVLV